MEEQLAMLKKQLEMMGGVTKGLAKVSGSCTDGQVDDEWVMVPNGSISSIFNGKELSKLTTRTIRKGVYTETENDGNITVVQVLRKIQ